MAAKYTYVIEYDKQQMLENMLVTIYRYVVRVLAEISRRSGLTVNVTP